MTRLFIRAGILLLLAIFVVIVIHFWSRSDVLVGGRPLPSGHVQPKLISAWNTGVLLAPDGSLWTWGGSDPLLKHVVFGTNARAKPHPIGVGHEWRDVAASGWQMLAIRSDGSLWNWGTVAGFQMQTNGSVPQRIGTDNDWSRLSAGVSHAVALKTDGTLWTWGQNLYGQLGNGSTNQSAVPGRIGSETWREIACGAFNSYAIRADGTLWAWGLDVAGARGTNHDFRPRQLAAETNWTAISASDYGLLALQTDGSLWLYGPNARYWSNAASPVLSDRLERIATNIVWREVHCGEMHFIGRDNAGQWWAYGNNHDGQLGLGSSDDVLMVSTPRRVPYQFHPLAIDAGASRGTTLILLGDGSLWSSGIRLGETPRSTRWNSAKAFINRQTFLLFSRSFLRIRQHEIDTVPRKIWNLPSAGKSSVGPTNSAPAQTQR